MAFDNIKKENSSLSRDNCTVYGPPLNPNTQPCIIKPWTYFYRLFADWQGESLDGRAQGTVAGCAPSSGCRQWDSEPF